MTLKFIEEIRSTLNDLIGIAEEYVILYEDGLNVSPEECEQNTRVVEVEAMIEQARKLLQDASDIKL